MTRTGPSPLEWTVFFRIVDSCAEKSVSSAKSSSTYIVMGTEVGLHSRIDDDFLNKEEAAWNEHYPMAAFEFDPTPKEDWAKQVLYDHKPFDNTIHSGSRVISPRAYFAIRNPTEGDMRKMLQNLSFEKQFLGEMNSLTNTQIKVNRRPSEGFAAPAVPMAEVLTAKQMIDKFGVTPVDQTKVDDAQLKKNADIEDYLGSQARLSTLSAGNSVSNANEQTIRPVFDVSLDSNQPSVANTQIDLTNIQANVPSLQPARGSVSGGGRVESSVPDASISQPEPSLFLQPSLFEVPSLHYSEKASVGAAQGEKSETNSLHSHAATRTDASLYSPQLGSPSRPVLDAAARKQSPVHSNPNQFNFNTREQPPAHSTLEQPTFNATHEQHPFTTTLEQPILEHSIDTLPSLRKPQTDTQSTGVVFKGSDEDLLATLLFGSKEAGDRFLHEPLEESQHTDSNPFFPLAASHSPVSAPSPLYSGSLSRASTETEGYSDHDVTATGLRHP